MIEIDSFIFVSLLANMDYKCWLGLCARLVRIAFFLRLYMVFLQILPNPYLPITHCQRSEGMLAITGKSTAQVY